MADDTLSGRQKSILSTREIESYADVEAPIRSGKLVAPKRTFATAVMEALLGRRLRSPVTGAFAESVFQMLIDHGGNVSGAVNTMITARAGKDMTASLASGLLTIGPRFGGAINDAARAWHAGVLGKESPEEFVERQAKEGKRIPGIGHRKYRVGIPDPRIAVLSRFATLLKKHPHYDFARSVEKVTTGKNGSLILNVDGAIAALLSDILIEGEKASESDFTALLEAEFFNAIFIIPRSVGFIAHFMEQKENDEGLFRLPDDLLYTRKNKSSR
jgi:ATP citrate (pro-S)-lyase